MKLTPRMCPNYCKETRKRRVRMVVLSTFEEKKPIIQSNVLLNWFCQQCGYMEPVSYNEVRKYSRYFSAHSCVSVRLQYEKEKE